MSTSETKHCSVCGELIPAFATKCSHCNEYQSKLQRAFRNPVVLIPIMLIPFIFFFFLFRYDINSHYSSYDKFTTYESSFSVHAQNIAFGSNTKGSYVILLGSIKNDSDLIWEHPTFEVKYFNTDNELIDADTQCSYELVLYPGKEVTFRLRSFADLPQSQYSRAEICIISAETD